ncbi:MAG: adenylate/guanylate cyclase domain-containing protein [Bacteroidia bacterium]|nr:adenylate/guanylate cyclase domain-containing protein [Bacteroidia bacterium]
MSARIMDSRTWHNTLERAMYGALTGSLYALSNLGGLWELILVCAVSGFLVGFSTGVLDWLLFLTPLRRQPFLVVLAVRTLAYLGVISLCMLLVLGLYTQIELRRGADVMPLYQWVTQGNFLYVVIYSLILLTVLQFIILISRLVGPHILLNYLLGRYHQPKEEERIFMFMDLRASTTIAERLGPMKWHQFLNDFFYDIAQPVRRSRGEIYQYVGDEVVISWPKTTGLQKLNCIHCFFGIWDKMEKRHQYYLDRYGYEPIFKAGYHVGRVIAGEIGDFKRDIVFHGDTVNTASRIQAECNHFNRRLLLSDTLLRQLDLGKEYTAEYITTTQLPGKEEVLQLYSLDPVIIKKG